MVDVDYSPWFGCACEYGPRGLSMGMVSPLCRSHAYSRLDWRSSSRTSRLYVGWSWGSNEGGECGHEWIGHGLNQTETDPQHFLPSSVLSPTASPPCIHRGALLDDHKGRVESGGASRTARLEIRGGEVSCLRTGRSHAYGLAEGR